MTEQEYDEIIAPMLAEVAAKVEALGGSIGARVEWATDEAGITRVGVTRESGVGQQLTDLAALSRGNIDQIVIQAARRFDMSGTLVGTLVGGPSPHDACDAPRPT